MMNDEYIVKTVLHVGSETINFVPGTKVRIYCFLYNYTRFLPCKFYYDQLFLIGFIPGYISF